MVSFQFDSGEIPPIIDNKAEDPLWEEKQGRMNTHQGEFIHTRWPITIHARCAFCGECIRACCASLMFLQQLANSAPRTNTARSGAARVLQHLPESAATKAIAGPLVLDDFWSPGGWRAGAEIAASSTTPKAWTDAAAVRHLEKRGVRIDHPGHATARRGLRPGCGKGDYDPTSTAAGIVYAGKRTICPNLPLPPPLICSTRIYRIDRARRGNCLTPYEIRTVLAYL
jgi:hypothetical protein